VDTKCGDRGLGIGTLSRQVPLHDQLMRANDELQGVLVVEGFCDVLPERVPRSPRRDSPPVPLIRVRPHQVTDRTLVGDLDVSVQLLYVLDPVERGREASVGAEDSIVDNGGKGEEVKQVRKMLPNVRRSVDPQAFVVKPINLSDLAALMVSASQTDSVGIPNLKSNEEEHTIEGIIASINIVTKEKVVMEGRLSANFK